MAGVGFDENLDESYLLLSALTLSLYSSLDMLVMSIIYMQIYAWSAVNADDQSPGSPSWDNVSRENRVH